jgi:hypothetical protein
MTMDHAKHFGDAGALAMTVATVAGWLPAIAALASLIWTCIRIYETKTVQGWLKGWDK